MLRKFRSFARAAWGRSAFERDLDDEIRAHLESRTDDLVRKGLAPDEAARQARREFGNPTLYRDRCRDARRLTLWDDLRIDLRFALRNMRKDAFLSTAIVATLALGIGATAAMFSAVNAALLRPLPFPEPSQLVMVFGGTGGPLAVFGPDYTEWRGHCGVCADMAAIAQWQSTVAGGAQPERVLIGRVTASFFTTVGVQPMLGRGFLAGEMGRGLLGNIEQPVENAAVILGASLWRRQFGGDPAIVGKTIRIEGDPSTVVGVMPDGFSFPDRAEAWVPAAVLTTRGNAYQRVIARLRPGTSLAQADAELKTLIARVQAQAPDERRAGEVHLVPLQEYLVGDVRTSLTIFLAAVGLVLLIACANVANLLLAQAATRPREIAIRTILGAGRRRLVRQLLTESLVLSLAGGAAGILIAAGILAIFRGTLPEAVPRLNAIGIDGWVLAFVAAISILTGLTFGLAPAWRTAKADLSAALKAGGSRAFGGAERGRVRGALVVAEVSLALVLLIGAGLLLKSFVTLRTRPLGFNPSGVVIGNVTLPEAGYGTAARTKAYFREALARLQAQPDLQTAGLVSALPLARTGARIRGDITPEGETRTRKGIWVNKIAVGGDYFRAMGIPLVRGRLFDAHDGPQAPGVFIISQSLADRLWPGRSPLGRHVSIWGDPREIVGIVADVKQDGLGQGGVPAVYEPFEQVTDGRRWLVGEMTFVLRPAGSAALAVQRLRTTLLGIDQNVPLYDVAQLRDVVAGNAADPRFYALLMGAFSLIAFVLSIAGIYGVVSYSVRQRSHELGVRMALGAQRSNVMTLVLREGMALVGIGAILGLAGAYAGTRALRTFLFRVDVTDPATFVAVPLLLGAVALIACYIPARRATATDPLRVLKYE
jgi:putative ABC transport system permease protein